MPIAAGRFRHWVDIQAPTDVQDSAGEITRTWATIARVPAGIEPLSAREFIAAQAQQSKVTARVVLRPVDGLSAAMRIVIGSKIYNIEGVLPDPVTGGEYVTLPVSEGVNDGG